MNQNRHDAIKHSHQTLIVYLYYRVALSGVLLAMFFTDIAPNILGQGNEDLYYFTCLSYFFISLVSPFVFPASSLQYSQRRIHFLLLVDLCTQLILIHASDGMDGGLGYLLIITIAMMNIFVRGQLAFMYTAFASIALIIDNLYLHRGTSDFGRIMFTSGVLGVLLFATTISLQYFTEKIRRASAEAAAQSRHIRNLQEIAENIVTRMQTGVIVVDNELKIELMNDSAKQMLNIPPQERVFGEYLASYRELIPVLKNWEAMMEQSGSTILNIRPGFEVRVNIAHLETGDIPKNIFYLEDHAGITQYAQQLKLASLGKLAARIAHEIRNPLGALSHASQLLAESPALDKTDKRMTEIIKSNCERVNVIIENTLTLSRRKEPQPEQIDLTDWLPTYIDETHYEQIKHIQLNLKAKDLLTRFDLTHLQQILTNLIDNGLRHSAEKNGVPWLEIEAGLQKSDTKPYIEVRDNGAGVAETKLAEIYEPFYTTSKKGSGLGLYISKELAEINHASLHYNRSSEGLSCFRIDFSHHQRMH